MATQNLTIQAQYGSGYAWLPFTTTGSNDGDNNRFYIGGSDTRGRTRFKVTIPSDLVGVPNAIVIGMKCDEENCTPGKMRAYLSTNADVDSDIENWISAKAILQTSYWYTDDTFTTRAPSGTVSPTFIFCRFRYTFTKGGTYYIGVFPYSSDSSAQSDTDYSAVWFRGRNMSGYLTAYVGYPLPTYTVSYNANGGTGAPGNQTKKYGTNLTLSSTIPSRATSTSTFIITGNGNGGTTKTITATKSISYSFAGWAITSGGSVRYNPGGTYSTNASVTLYAVWNSTTSYSNNTISALGTTTRKSSSAGQYVVTLDANGASYPTVSKNAARTNVYTFLGWGSTSGATSNLPGSTAYTSATTVYARWSSSVTTVRIALPPLERTGYTFLGWAETADAKSGITGLYTPSKDITLYAIWDANGLVYIDNGTSFDAYQVFIDNGSSWDQYMPYLDNGSGWDVLT